MLKTLTKTSTKTKVLTAIVALAAIGAVLAYGFSGYQARTIDQEKAKAAKGAWEKIQADWKKKTTLDTTMLEKGDPRASAEVERWLNANIEYQWSFKGGKYDLERELYDVICKFIDGTLAPSDMINGCKTGSTVITKLGSGRPYIIVESTNRNSNDQAKQGVFRYGIKFGFGMKSTDADISVQIKCKGPLLHVDGVCPDPTSSMSYYETTLAPASGVLEVTSKPTVKMLERKGGKVTAGLNLKLCFKVAILGRSCWNIGEQVTEAADKPINDFFARTLDGL